MQFSVPQDLGVKLPVEGVRSKDSAMQINLDGFSFGVISQAVGSFMGSAALSFNPPTTSVPADITVQFHANMILASHEEIYIRMPGFSSETPVLIIDNVTAGPGFNGTYSNFTARWEHGTLVLKVKCGVAIGLLDRVSVMVSRDFGIVTPAEGVRLNDAGSPLEPMLHTVP